MNKNRLIRLIIILALGLGLSAAITSYQIKKDKNSTNSNISGYIVAENFGGPFTLTNQNGVRVTEKDFQGLNRLLYFGFTFCPAICPTELQKITNVLNNLGEKADNFMPIFITVDPERDTIETMKQYVSLFHPRLIGLTGSLAQIEEVKKSYKVYAAKVEDETMSEYTVDHSSFIYLIDENDDLRRIFKIDDTAEDITTYINNNF
ncbi:MAG: SCO family protein [Pseudomonadota bacterium]